MTHPAALHDDEPQRLAQLRALAVLDTGPEMVFDSLTRVAAEVCGVPIALLGFVDEDRLWFKSNIGLPETAEIPRQLAFCSHAVLGTDVMEVTDAQQDGRFADNPLVTGDPYIRFYAGAPITLSDGLCLGTLCVIDRTPRKLAEQQLSALRHLAVAVAQALEFRARTAQSLAMANQARAKLAQLYTATPAMLHSIDTTGRLLMVSDTWLSELGYAREEALGRPSSDFLTPASRERAIKEVLPAFFRSGRCDDVEYQMVRKDGGVIDVLLSAVLEYDEAGQPLRTMAVIENVTPRKRMERELAESRELLQVTLDSIADAVITTDTRGEVQWLNPVAERMTGWRKSDAEGKALAEVFVVVNEEDRKPIEDLVAVCLAKGRIMGIADHATLVSRDGTEYGIEESASPIRDAGGQVHGAVLVFRDVSEQRRLSREMSHRATHDALTGLVNRAEFESRLERLIERNRHDDGTHALLYIDLDQFKLVNDACGHSVGDQLLRQFSTLLLGSVRGRDTVARLGGDEFGVILEHCDTKHAQRVAQKICDQMEEFRFLHDGRRLRVGSSIGLVPVDGRWTSIAAVLQAADTSCYAAKEAGRNRVHAWFDTDHAMRARLGEMQLVTRLEQALDEGRFELYGQRIEPMDGTAAGLHCEVLLRLREPDGTIVAPGAFLPAAERFHMATRIDRWVVRQVFEWMRRAGDAAGPLEMIAVNLSGRSIGDLAFHRDVSDMIRRASFDVRKLCFEITETSAITSLGDAKVFINEVRALGVKIALDDFGAGASSFSYLKTLPVDYLKIDGQFITDLLEDELDNAAVRCFRDVAKVVGVKTIAEFVEREDVRNALREIGIDLAQGYLIHRPEPLASLVPKAVARM